MPAKILIVDDHEVVREGVRTLINRERPQWEVCGEAKSAPEALEACRRLKPNVTVLDITMPGMSGLEVASSMFELGSRVLMFTMHESEHLASEVSRAGAQGFVLKSQAAQDLIRAIEARNVTIEAKDPKLLEETRVGLAPGVAFGDGGEGSFRICYAAERSILEPAMERLTRFLRSYA